LDDIYEIIGASHIHSTYSDGTWDIKRISQTADELGLDFLLFSDHHTLKPKQEGLEGFYGGTLSLIGYETSDTDDLNHYLAFQLDDVVPGVYPREYVSEIARRNGLGFIAHPIEKRNILKDYPPYPWTAWDCEGYDGIEIWNQLSEWMEGLRPSNKFYRFIHPLHSTIAPPPELLTKWDELAKESRVIGIAGIDAHSFEVKTLGLFKVKIFHYKVMLKSLRNHLLLREPFPRSDSAKAEELVFDAIRDARLFFSNHRRGDARGFRFRAVNESNTAIIGENIDAAQAIFIAESPLQAEITLIGNGKPLKTITGKRLEYRTDKPGAYRIEARRKKHAWVFTNHIYSENRLLAIGCWL